MGQQNRIVEREEPFWNLRLVLVDVEAGGENGSGLERLDQGPFVDDGAAGDVDENPVRAEGGKQRGVDEAARAGAAGRGDHEDVAGLRHCGERGIEAISRVGLRAAAVVDDLEPEAFGPRRNRLADPPEAQDSHGAAAQRRGEGKSALLAIRRREGNARPAAGGAPP